MLMIQIFLLESSWLAVTSDGIRRSVLNLSRAPGSRAPVSRAPVSTGVPDDEANQPALRRR